jgi:ATP-dependent Clp protease ATP-binding subunit ClpB
MTSNVGSSFILERGTRDWAEIETVVTAELRRQFKPEFLNRVDDIIIFHPLGMEQLDRIIDLQLRRLEQLLGERKMTIELTPEARRAIAEEGYDPAFGARPLKRAIQRLIQNPLALAVLEGRFGEGDHVVVSVGANGELTFEKVGDAVPAGVGTG